MDEETLWILRKLAAKEIPARSAERILRALDLLREAEKAADSPITQEQQAARTSAPATTETPEAMEQVAPIEEESSAELRSASPSDWDSTPSEDAETVYAEVAEEAVEEEQDAEAETEQEVDVAEKESDIAQVDTPPVEEIESMEHEDSERDEALSESEQMKDDADEEQAIISYDVEYPVIQGSRTALDAENVEAAQSSEVAIAEEELPVVQEGEMAGEPEPQEIDSLTSEELEAAAEVTSEEAQEYEEPTSSDIDWEEAADEVPLLDDSGVGIVEEVPDDAQMILENVGDVRIQCWDQAYIRAEGEAGSFVILRAGKKMKIQGENGIILYIPPTIAEISVVKGSGSIDIEKYPNEVFIDRDSGDIDVREASGVVRARSTQANITMEDCRGEFYINSGSGNITVMRTSGELNRHTEAPEAEAEDIPAVAELNVEAGSGSVTLTDISSNMDVRTGGGNVTIERSGGRRISVESSGGDMTLKEVINSNLNLTNESGTILLEGFSGEVRIKAKDTGISLRKSGDAQIHVESDGGDIKVEDCYADVHVNSGMGNVYLSGGDLSFGGMGKVELEMKSGDAYLHRRTFEDIRIVIEEGSAEVNMEKLDSGGSGQISVYKGNITARVLPSFGCELIAHGSRKKMSIELPVEIIEKDENRLRGTLNGGGSKMQLIAPNGEINFQALEPVHV